MSTPPFDHDDPRLTAYALGEADEAVRLAVEALLVHSPEARAEVEQTKAFARELGSEYAREHELYLASRREAELLSNVVRFPSSARGSGNQTAVLAWKAAAVVALSASLVYLTLRRPQRPEVMTAASAPPGTPANVISPAPVLADQLSKDSMAAARDQDLPNATLAAAPEPPAATATSAPAATPMGSRADTLLAMDRSESRRRAVELSPGSAPAPADATTAPAPPSVTRAARYSDAPAAAKSATMPENAARRPARPASVDDRIAQVTVRIRTAAGKFLGGVLVSPDGVVLAVNFSSASTLQQPCTVLLADHRELPAVVHSVGTSERWYRLRVEASGLPAAPLADAPPANDAQLTVPQVDPQTGTVTYTKVRRAESVANAGFAFNAAGELLVATLPNEHAADTRAKTAGSAPARAGFRPLTPAERAMLKPAAGKTGGE